MCHVKLDNLNMKTLMIIWLKVSLCPYIWDQIGETMLADLHSRASCYIVADSWTTCYIVAVKPSQAAYAGKASMIKAPYLWLFLMRSLWCRKLHLTGKKSNEYQANLQSTVMVPTDLEKCLNLIAVLKSAWFFNLPWKWEIFLEKCLKMTLWSWKI